MRLLKKVNPSRFRRMLSWTLVPLTLGVATLVVGNSTPPEINLATEPLYTNGSKAKANLTLALSVEFPTVGQTYRDNFDANKVYIGYFDPTACYTANLTSGTSGNYFDWKSLKASASAACPSSQFDGNFMNWATSSAIDIMRYGLTGGNRTTDEATSSGKTIIERAWLPDSFYKNSTYFSEKFVSNSQLSGRTELSPNQFPNGMWIYNCRNRVYFANEQDNTATRSCDSPFGVANAQSPKLIKANSNNNGNFYEVRNLVCDPSSAPRRLMTYDPNTKKWSGLCWLYPNGKYKPVGQLQMNAENVRVAVFGYLKDDARSRYGGVMRSPMKYLGPRKFDASFNLETAVNAQREWDANTGVFLANPQDGDSSYGDQGFGQSGAINYINKFGTLNPNWTGTQQQDPYKLHDPVSELYYEAVRYLQGKQPTSQAVSGFSGNASSDRNLKENFPAYANWTDPFTGFVDATGNSASCLRNSIATIADVFTHSDRSLPGNSNITNQDFARGFETNPTLDVPFWTSVVGSFESQISNPASVQYLDSKGRTQRAGNLASNAPFYPALAAAATVDTGAQGGSYYLAGLAYWANTQSFRTDLPKGRISTYAIDVNEDRASNSESFRRQRQLYLAAKYGGFDDAAAGHTGNPYAPGSNALWQGSDGDAKNYFLVSDAAKFLDSIAEVFVRTVAQTGSIAGGAISTQRLTSVASAAVFQARYNPVANFWSGRVLKYPLTLSADQSTVEIGATEQWEAGQVLTTATGVDHGVSRNIVVGPPPGRQGVQAATPFQWSDLASEHKTVLNTAPGGTTDTLGELRLNYLRGDRREEQSGLNPTGIFRPRDIVLGDVVNSGLVYMDKPAYTTPGAAFRTFYDANKNRKPVVFVNANDGMLHAFYDQNGAEAFAYVPGFLASKLNRLPDQNYNHMSLADATPAISDAFVRGAWRTALVSGVGGGGQGVFALDVSNPENFTKDNVLWEFTDRDHPAMGNVLGTPQILKFRVPVATAASPTYKHFAVVASGVNNYASDGRSHSGGNPSLFFLDLDFVPTATQGWVEGTNFWRIELPQTNFAIAKGLVGFNSVLNFTSRAVDALYAGDLQGNLWKLDFTVDGTSGLGSDAAANFQKFNRITGDAPLFVAKAANGTTLQPITGTPEILNSYYGEKMVVFGTGKFLENSDMTVPLVPTASFYAVADDPSTPIAGRTSLQQGTLSSAGVITMPAFTLGSPPTASPNVKSGWYVDLNSSIAERQVSNITAVAGKLMFGTIYPTRGACGEGGGRVYVVDALTGNGGSEESEVGILAAPLVLNIGSTQVGASETSGQRTATEKFAVVTQGAKGLKMSNITGTYSFQAGRMSWRQINNYQASKAAP